jgi:membrane fusion protein (multidrug efflux system)
MIGPFTSPRWAAAAVLVGLSVAACHKDSGTAADAASDEKPSVEAQTVTVTRQSFTETLGAIGIVNARAGHSAALSAPAPGRVANILVATGQTVAKNQVLIELDQAPFVAATQSAQAALALAQQSFDRQQRLANEGIVARKEVEQASADLARAKADAAAAQRFTDLSTIRSPINGVVTRLTATLGSSADPSQVLIEIADPSALDVLFNVTPTDAGRIHSGVKVTFSAGQDASGEPLGVGTVIDVGGTVDSATRGVAVRAQTPTTRRPLRIGETVFGSIAIAVRPSAIVIPVEALVPEGDGFKVFVVDGAGMANERDVTIGGKTDKVAEIIEGLTPGERVATKGAYGLEDSVKVVPLGTDSAKKAEAAKKDTEKKVEKP